MDLKGIVATTVLITNQALTPYPHSRYATADHLTQSQISSPSFSAGVNLGMHWLASSR